MSTFWSLWITLLTVINIYACYWLIKWTAKKREGEPGAGEVTGHSWDGLEEYNNPMPRWWLWMFYLTIVFGVAYLALYPGLGNFKGLLGWTQTGQYDTEMETAKAKYDPIFEGFASKDLITLAADTEGKEAGRRLFVSYCAQCHGSDAGGAIGFPNLTDKDWLWGGEPEMIKTSIMNGRNAMMPAWGPILGDDGVDKVTAYVQTLAGRKVDSAKADAGKAIFNTNCAMCHMPDGSGNPMMGAPRLSDNIWLYGGSAGAIKKSIKDGRSGKMPPHREFLGENKVHVLAAYLYGLSN